MTLPPRSPSPCRADIKQYIGLPSAAAVFKIYHSCIQELMRVREKNFNFSSSVLFLSPPQAGIITPAQQILDLKCLEMMRLMENDATRLSLKLREIAR